MLDPKITVLLCTVRPDRGYVEHPEWHTLGKVIADLSLQTFKDFELLVVDGLWGNRDGLGVTDRIPTNLAQGTLVEPFIRWQADSRARGEFSDLRAGWLPPRDTLWTLNHKVAICAYRNTGLIHARGELVVNLDDCCELPPNYLESFWYAWSKHKVCLAATWPESGDSRPAGVVTGPGQVYGFGSYPLEAAVAVNGYDEAYDGGQGLEDADWSTRLYNAGVKMALARFPGFLIHAQSAHDPRVIDPKEPIVKCCNLSWDLQRNSLWTRIVNTPEMWSGSGGKARLQRLLGPCFLLRAGRCGFHSYNNTCPYLEAGFADRLHPLAAKLFEEPPIFDLATSRREVVK